MNRRTLHPVLFLAALLAQGCSGLLTSEQPARSTYMLMPLEGPAMPAHDPPGTRLTVEMTAVPGLDTNRIQALGSDARLNQYGNTRWPDHLPEVLASVLRRSLESSGQFDSVREGPVSREGDWHLKLEVREFYGILDTTGDTASVRVALAGSLNCDGRPIALNLHDANPVTEQRVASVVAAHQAGLDGITRQLVELIGTSCTAEAAQ